MALDYFVSGSFFININENAVGRAKTGNAENGGPDGGKSDNSESKDKKPEKSKLQLSIPYSVKRGLICQVAANPGKNGEERFKDSVDQMYLSKGCLALFPHDLLLAQFRSFMDKRKEKLTALDARISEEGIAIRGLKYKLDAMESSGAASKEEIAELKKEIITREANLTALNDETDLIYDELDEKDEELGNVKAATVEPNGRMILDPELAEKAHLKAGVVNVFGRGDHLEIWDRDVYNSRFPEKPNRGRRHEERFV